jgi:hypothetical protein
VTRGAPDFPGFGGVNHLGLSVAGEPIPADRIVSRLTLGLMAVGINQFHKLSPMGLSYGNVQNEIQQFLAKKLIDKCIRLR